MTEEEKTTGEAEEAAKKAEGDESNETKEVAVVAEESPILQNLIILPPKQKDGTLDRDELMDAVPLPPIRMEEPVSSIRAALSEVVGYSHLTNFRFVLEEPPVKSSSKASSGDSSPLPTVSPYTGKNAIVSIPVAVKSLEMEPQTPPSSQDETINSPKVLDDYGDLLPLVENGLTDGSAFRVVLERYDVASVRDHVTRLRSLLDGNAPSATSLDEAGAAASGGGGESKQEKTAGEDNSEESAVADKQKPAEAETPASDNEAKKEEKKGEDAKKESGKSTPPPPQDMPSCVDGKPVTSDIENLKNFFYYACGEDPALYAEDYKDPSTNSSKGQNGKSKRKGKKGGSKDKSSGSDNENEKAPEPSTEKFTRETIPRLNELEERTRVRCQIRFSGFHPPPAFRRLVGDLSYLEVTPPGEGSKVIHITAIPTGFYVNRSSLEAGFDPSPANKPCFSHELLDCLLQCSPSIAEAWTDALAASKERGGLMAKLNLEGPYASLFRVAIRGDFSGYSKPSTASASEGIDALIQSPSWLVPIPKITSESKKGAWKRNNEHRHSLSRTEEDMSNAFGVDIRSGTVRDWNEELQSAREMPIVSLQERIERAR